MRYLSEIDVEDRVLLSRALKEIADELNTVSSRVDAVRLRDQRAAEQERAADDKQPAEPDPTQLSRELSSTGKSPLNVEGLSGRLADAQYARAILTADIATLNAQDYPPLTIAIKTGPPDVVYYRNEAKPPGWTALSI